MGEKNVLQRRLYDVTRRYVGNQDTDAGRVGLGNDAHLTNDRM